MMPSLKSLLAAAGGLACLGSAKTIKVIATSDNTFDPDVVTAQAGDVVEFHFEPKNHSVAAGDYRYPCTPLNGDDESRFFSAFVPVDGGEASKVFRVTVNSSAPTAFYSTQGSECAKGMVGIINQSGNMTLDDYKSRASVLSQGVTPGSAPFGGVLAGSDGKGGGSGSSSSSSPESTGGSRDDDGNAAVSVRASTAGILGVIVLAACLV